MKKILLMLLASIVPLEAYTEENLTYTSECSKMASLISKHEQVDLSGYTCGKNIKKTKRFNLENFKPIATIAFDNYYSSAYYMGDHIIEGKVYFPEGPNDTLTLETPKASFNFGSGSKKDLESIKYPAKFNSDGSYDLPTCESGTLKAKAKIKIRLVHDIISDSCQGGLWILDSKIISVGKYSCMP